MDLTAALECLGGTRVIWIDDHFDDDAERLGDMLANDVEITRACGIQELEPSLAEGSFDEDGIRGNLKQTLLDISVARRREIKAIFFEALARGEEAPTREMTVREVERACGLLKINPDDQWSFSGVERRIRDVCAQGDGNVSYIVDLKDAADAGGSKSGLRIVTLLAAEGSQGTAFILTHETRTEEEVDLEQDLHASVVRDGGSSVPLCVISKERLANDGADGDGMVEAFRVAIKRAGLRRSIHEVVSVAEPRITQSFEEARSRLLRIAPERLEDHVVSWGEHEGVSELHVIERAITAYMARDIRDTFASPNVLSAIERLRALRAIPLKRVERPADPDLVSFRDAETWETDQLINGSYALLTCGDVFEIEQEGGIDAGADRQRFVLLVQPCDVQLRSDGYRSVRTGVLAPLRRSEVEAEEVDKVKEYDLPCSIDGRNWTCDLRDAANVDLHILDLATFRSDGRVRYDQGQLGPRALLPGQQAIFGKRTGWLDTYLADAIALAEVRVEHPEDERPGDGKEADVPILEDATVQQARERPAAVHDAEAQISSDLVLAGETGGTEGGSDIAAQRQRRKDEKKLQKAKGKQRAETGAVSSLELKIRQFKLAARLMKQLQLAFAAPTVFDLVEVGIFIPGDAGKIDGEPSLPHVTWRLRRVGRIRMPFAADILDRYVRVINRTAFDPDFVEPPRPAPAATAGATDTAPAQT